MHMDLFFDTAGIESVIAAATALGVEGGPIRRPKLYNIVKYRLPSTYTIKGIVMIV
jgi:hypothetical protein